MNTKIYKEKLEEELILLENELSSLGTKNPKTGDWEASVSLGTAQDDDHSDPNDNADDQEEFGERTAILSDLEIRYNNIKKALERIEKGTFGICEVSGNKIEEERLDANPASTRCIEHMED